MGNDKSRFIDLDKDFVEEESEQLNVNEQLELFKESMWKTVETATNDVPSSVEEQIASQYKMGVSVVALAEKYDMSHGAVYAILRRKGVPLRRQGIGKSYDRVNSMTKEEKNNLIREYTDGVPLHEIYKKYNINKHGTYIILDQANVPRRGIKNVKRGKPAKKPASALTFNPTSAIVNPSNNEKVGMNGTKTSPIEISLKDGVLHINITEIAQSPVDKIYVTFDPKEG